MAWNDWMYKTSPIWDYPRVEDDFTVPAPNPWENVDPQQVAASILSGVALPGAQPKKPVALKGKSYSYTPVQIGRERDVIPNPEDFSKPGPQRKSTLGKALTEVLPRALFAGIAGAATPNVAGGGPTDFFRAVQAGQQALDTRDANKLALMEKQRSYEHQQREEQINAAVKQAQMQADVAHAGYWEAERQKALRGENWGAEFGARVKAAREQFPNATDEQIMALASKATYTPQKPAKPAADPYKGMSPVLPNDPAYMLPGRMDPDGKTKWVDNSLLITEYRPRTDPADRPPTVWRATGTDPNTKTLNVIESSPEGYRVTDTGLQGQQPRQTGGNRRPTANDRNQLDQKFNQANTTAKGVYDKAMAAIDKLKEDLPTLKALAPNSPLLREQYNGKMADIALREKRAKASYDETIAANKLLYDQQMKRLDDADAAAASSTQPKPAPAKPPALQKKTRLSGAAGIE